MPEVISSSLSSVNEFFSINLGISTLYSHHSFVVREYTALKLFSIQAECRTPTHPPSKSELMTWHFLHVIIHLKRV